MTTTPDKLHIPTLAEMPEVAQYLRPRAQQHAAESNGKFVLLPDDEVTLETHIVADPDNPPLWIPEQIKGLGSLVEPRFNKLLEAVESEAERQPDVLHAVGHALENGTNIILATNHGELSDIAFTFGAINHWLSSNGYEDIVRASRRTMIVSQMTSLLGARQFGDLSVPKALTSISDLVVKTWPQAESLAELRKILGDTFNAQNREVKQTIDDILTDETRPAFIAMAPSGAKDKLRKGSKDTYTLHSLSKGTMEMMMTPNTAILFMGALLAEKPPVVGFSGLASGPENDSPLTRITTYKEADLAMVGLSKTLHMIQPTKKFKYASGLTTFTRRKQASEDY